MGIDEGRTTVNYSATDGARLLAFFASALVMIFVEPLYGVLALVALLVAISTVERE